MTIGRPAYLSVCMLCQMLKSDEARTQRTTLHTRIVDGYVLHMEPYSSLSVIVNLIKHIFANTMGTHVLLNSGTTCLGASFSFLRSIEGKLGLKPTSLYRSLILVCKARTISSFTGWRPTKHQIEDNRFARKQVLLLERNSGSSGVTTRRTNPAQY